MKRIVLFFLIFFVVFSAFVIVAGFVSPNRGIINNNISLSNKDTHGIQLTLEEVAKHNTTSDCWMVIGGKVYDITSYFGQHPGGDESLALYCGKDGTEAYNTKDGTGHSSFASDLLPPYYIGDIGGGIVKEGVAGENQQVPQDQNKGTVNIQKPVGIELTLEEVVKHNTTSDCWMVIGGKVYNLTSYFGYHPGGDPVLSDYCGKEATQAYETKGKPGGSDHSASAYSLLGGYYIGDLNSTSTVTDVSPPPPPTRGDDDEHEDEHEDD